MHLPATTSSSYQAPPAIVRAAVLGRRVKASPSVAALLADLAFGQVDRDRATIVPVLTTEVLNERS